MSFLWMKTHFGHRGLARGILCLLLYFMGGEVRAARVLFYPAHPANPVVENRLEIACRFYGIDLEKGAVDSREEEGQRTPTAVVIEAGALDHLSMLDLPFENRAILIAGIGTPASAQSLRLWLRGAVQLSSDVIRDQPNQVVRVSADRADLAVELAGQQLPVDIAEGISFRAGSGSPIMTYSDGRVLFLEVEAAAQPTYLLANLRVIDPVEASTRFYDHGFFAEIAPYMMFLKKTFGEYAWHAESDYANLTIDDPWLREPYGNLHYATLLREMDQAHFHTTIAYIPWNYDRPSAASVVELFRDRPDRFSLCVHGNNHDHREFYRTEELPGASWPARPLLEQEQDIRQGLARIHRFEKTSGLPVDRVMVFPHDIAPASTLELLKKYNFLATSNIGMVPLDEPPPTDALFWLHRVSDSYGGGLSAWDRTEAHNRTSADIAVDLFLDNPVLFVEHLRFFADDSTAFNAIAQRVNALQPSVQWCSLGTIARGMYRIRKQDSGTYLVHSFSPELILRNRGRETRQYRIKKTHFGEVAVNDVRVDGRSVSWSRPTNQEVHVELSIPPQQQRRLHITFQNDLDVGKQDLSKSDLRINLLRGLSDLRDQYLSAGFIGALIDRFYYDSKLYQFGLKAVAAVVLVVAVCIGGGLVGLVRKIRNRNG